MSKAMIPDQCGGFACTDFSPNSWTWSLPAALGDYLSRAEERYGARDKSWTILGVQIHVARENPVMWFRGEKQVCVTLSKHAANDPNQALFQLAHEVIHLLAPRPELAPRIEEGVAVMFADDMAATDQTGLATGDPKYLWAKALVQEMLTIDANAISKLRAREPYFGKMTPALLLDVMPALHKNTAAALCEVV